MTDLAPISQDLYEILGVKDDAPVDEIKKAYKKLARQYHPDRFPNDEEARAQAEEIMAKVTEAYETLTDEEKRNEYDFMKKIQSGMAAGGPRGAEASPEEKVKERKAKAAQFFQQANDAMGRDPRKAAQILEDAIKLDPDNSDYYRRLAEIYFQMKLTTRARENAEKAIEKNPQNYDAKSLLKKINVAAPPGKAAPAAAAKASATKTPAATGAKKGEKKGGLFGWLFGK